MPGKPPMGHKGPGMVQGMDALHVIGFSKEQAAGLLGHLRMESVPEGSPPGLGHLSFTNGDEVYVTYSAFQRMRRYRNAWAAVALLALLVINFLIWRA